MSQNAKRVHNGVNKLAHEGALVERMSMKDFSRTLGV